jgi:hypothetical protein
MEDVLLMVFVLIPVALGATGVVFIRYVRSKGAKEKMSAIVTANVLILLFLISIALPIGEIYFRFIKDTTDSLVYTKVSRKWFRTHWVANNVGFRDNEDYSPQKPAGKRRVSFLGDSFTAGQGINHVESRFVNRIRALHREWDVQMLAQAGFDTGNELGYLEASLREGYQIDCVVLVYCLNDVSDMMASWTNRVSHLYADSQNAGWFVRNSYFLDFAFHRIKVARSPELKGYFGFIKDGYSGELWDRQKERLKTLHEMISAHGGQLLVVTFPFMQSLGAEYEYKEVHAKLNEFWQGQQVPHLDLLPRFQKVGKPLTVNRFDAHPNELAHEIATEEIKAFLERNMREPGK